MGERQDIKLPATLELKLQPGIKIGGTIRDEAGKPIAGANVELSMPITWPRAASRVFTLTEMKTDSAGRWQFDGAPSDTTHLSVRVKHPHYLPGAAQTTGRLDRSNEVRVLKQGLRVEGDVLDEKQNPIQGALAALGVDRFGAVILIRTVTKRDTSY
jgi:protocatechuate 3,4-dioxygenase beta subunit